MVQLKGIFILMVGNKYVEDHVYILKYIFKL